MHSRLTIKNIENLVFCAYPHITSNHAVIQFAGPFTALLRIFQARRIRQVQRTMPVSQFTKKPAAIK